ncbi:MAG: hypothetical protein WAL66_12265 [Nitrososphaeraceae archaeon]
MSIFRHSKSVFSLSLLILIIGMLDYSTNIDKLRTTSVTDDQASAASNFTDQTILQSDIKDIKKLTSEEVQLLKSLGQEFSRTATQSQFAALGIFLLGISLIIYGLRLTLRATDKQTSRYFKAMIWALIIPVIALIAIYQLGILLGVPILTYRVNEPFFFVSILLLIPAIIIIFLLIAERRWMDRSHQKDQQQ